MCICIDEVLWEKGRGFNQFLRVVSEQNTGKNWGCGFGSLLKRSFDSVGSGEAQDRALVSWFGFRLPGDSNAQSVLGTIELQLYLSNLREHEASVGPESMILTQWDWDGDGDSTFNQL